MTMFREPVPLTRTHVLHNVESTLVDLSNAADTDICQIYSLYVKETTATAGNYSVEVYTKDASGNLGVSKVTDIVKNSANTADKSLVSIANLFLCPMPDTDKKVYVKCVGAAGQEFDLWGSYAEDKE